MMATSAQEEQQVEIGGEGSGRRNKHRQEDGDEQGDDVPPGLVGVHQYLDKSCISPGWWSQDVGKELMGLSQLRAQKRMMRSL